MLPASGQSAGEITGPHLRVSVSALTPGASSCTLTLTDPQAVNLPVTVPVTLIYNSVLHVPESYATIQGAIDATTQDGDVVVVGDGTWTGTGNQNLNLRSRAITVRSANGPSGCTIDCGGSGSGFYIGRPPQRRKSWTGSRSRASNGGIRIGSGSPTIRNCRIIGNAGWGGMSIIYGSPIITDCVISGNSSTTDGGGLSWGDHVFLPVLANCVVSGNQAGRNGGGCYVPNVCLVTFDNCTIANNTAVGNGGGMYIDIGGNFQTVSPCSLTGNTAAQGGGIFANSSSSLISNWTLVNNHATDRGGGIGGYKAAPIVKNCLLYQNRADYRGGGVALQWPDTAGAARIENCTLTGNTAGNAGGGLFFQQGTYWTASLLKNTVLWGDSAPSGPEVAASSSSSGSVTLSVSYSDVQGGAAAVLLETGAASVECRQPRVRSAFP